MCRVASVDVFVHLRTSTCGEGQQLQVPRCKHLRGPDLDCTHSNTGQESLAKTVPSATADEIQGLTSYPENVLFRGHRKCTDSVHLGVVWKRLQSGRQCSTESRALGWAHLRVCSPLSAGRLPQTLLKTELLKSSRTQITLVTIFSFYCHLPSASGAWWQKLRDLGGASSLRPSGS